MWGRLRVLFLSCSFLTLCCLVSGGPTVGETLDSWRERLREQLPAEPHVGKENTTGHRSTSTQGEELARSDAASTGGPFSPEEDAEHSLRVQAASFAELESLTRENREALEGVRRLIGTPTGGSSSSGIDLANEDKLRELDRLIAMAKVLDEMTVSATLKTALTSWLIVVYTRRRGILLGG